MIADSAARLVRTAQALTDDDLHEASALPGWTRAHVLTHVAQGADSRTRLLRAAQAGRIGQQYPSEQARAEAIDAGARRPGGVIRADLERAIQECLTAIREHPSQLWDAPAIWLGGGSRPVRGVLPGLRRELEYHHVDLAAGYQPADWPDDFVATELSRVTALMDRRDDAPPMTLAGHGICTSAPARLSMSPGRPLAAGEDPHRPGPAIQLVPVRAFAPQPGQLGDVGFLDPAGAVPALQVRAGVVGAAFADLAAVVDGDLPPRRGPAGSRLSPADRVPTRTSRSA